MAGAMRRAARSVSADWLEAHHEAKLTEHRRFGETFARYEPSRVVDIGCGTGLRLDLLDKLIPPSCESWGWAAIQPQPSCPPIVLTSRGDCRLQDHTGPRIRRSLAAPTASRTLRR